MSQQRPCWSLRYLLPHPQQLLSDYIRVHDLRHSHVSLCIELGYSVVLVARRIGDTVPVVMRTYAHLYPNKQQELVSKLEAIGSPSSNDDESDLMSLG